jgi:hypothetical protein
MKPVKKQVPSKECITFVLLRIEFGDDEGEIVQKCKTQYGVETTCDEIDSWYEQYPDCAKYAEMVSNAVFMLSRNAEAEEIIAQTNQCFQYALTNKELAVWKQEFAKEIQRGVQEHHQEKLDEARCTWLTLPEHIQFRIKSLLLHPDLSSSDVITVLRETIKSLNISLEMERTISMLTWFTIEYFDELFRAEWEQEIAEQQRRHVLKNSVIELRSKGKTLKQVVKELSITIEDFVAIIEESKIEPTQTAQIQKALRIEDLQQRYLVSAEKRSEMLGKQVKKAVETLNKRGLEDVPSEKLMDFIVKASVVLAKEEQAMKPFGEIMQSW